MRNRLELKQGAWVRDRNWFLDFPDHWQIEDFSPKRVQVLDADAIEKKINAPIGFENLDEILKPGMSILIVCDDLSRPTRSDQLLPVLIKILEERGIERDGISILMASGTHAPMSVKEVMLKLGKKVVEEFRVYKHDFRQRGVFKGRTTRGTPVYVNRQMVKHDLVIGMGGIYPHSTAGFSGGAKLILGVSSIRTILHFHMFREGASTGGNIHNDFRKDVLEAAKLAGMHFIVNAMINEEREITELVSGDVEEAFEHGVEIARSMYGVSKPDAGDFDLVIADTYPFDATYAFTRKGWWPVRNIAQDCHKLILSSMHEGKGGHLVYPIPYDRRINKLRRLYYELIAFGPGYFFSHTLVVRLRKISSILEKMKRNAKASHGSGSLRGPVTNPPSVESDIPGRDVDILHCATGDAKKSLNKLPNRLFESPEQYIQYLTEIEGNRPLRVAFYRASSLTFPLQ